MHFASGWDCWGSSFPGPPGNPELQFTFFWQRATMLSSKQPHASLSPTIWISKFPRRKSMVFLEDLSKCTSLLSRILHHSCHRFFSIAFNSRRQRKRVYCVFCPNFIIILGRKNHLIIIFHNIIWRQHLYFKDDTLNWIELLMHGMWEIQRKIFLDHVSF